MKISWNSKEFLSRTLNHSGILVIQNGSTSYPSSENWRTRFVCLSVCV